MSITAATATPEMSNPHHPGSQPASGSGGLSGSGRLSNGSFEMVHPAMMGISPPGSTVGGVSMTDITLEQALFRMQELVRENAELREYLKENNEMMKKQFETLSQWKQKVREANSMNRDKFEQTRALITSLRIENEEQQGKMRDLRNNEDSLAIRIRSLEGELNTLKAAKMVSDQLAFNVVKQAEQQGVDVGDEGSQMVFVASADKEEKLIELELQLEQSQEEIDQLKDRCAHLELDNVQFRNNTEQLLKDLESTQQLKEQIQKENQDLRQETVELQQQLQGMLAESKNSLQRNQRPPVPGILDKGNIPIEGNVEEEKIGQTQSHTADDWQNQSGAVTAEVEQLQKRLESERMQVDALKLELASTQMQIENLKEQLENQKSEMESLQSRHDDRIQQLQREHESRIELLSQQQQAPSLQFQPMLQATHSDDVQSLRSQVLTLINEVHESMNKLQAANRMIESKSARVKELEMYSSQTAMEAQSHVRQLKQAHTIWNSRLLAEQQSHATTKQQMTELRKSFNQLVSDYKELLETFDQYKMEQEQRLSNGHNMDTISHLTAQVLAAEEAINMREERIKRLQLDIREKDETVAVLQAQADVFKSDFTAERDARSLLASEKERLRQELEAEQLKNQGLTDQLTRYTQQQLQDMQLRASQSHYPHPQTNQGPANSPHPSRETNYFQQASPYRNPAGTAAEPGGGSRGGFAGVGRGGNMNDLSSAMRAGGGQGAGMFGTEGATVNYSHFGGPGMGGGAGLYHGQQIYGGRDPQPQYQQRRPAAPMHMHHGQGGVAAQPSQHDEEDQTLYICPSCNQRLPDLDTLTIHVQECLDQNCGEGGRYA